MRPLGRPKTRRIDVVTKDTFNDKPERNITHSVSNRNRRREILMAALVLIGPISWRRRRRRRFKFIEQFAVFEIRKRCFCYKNTRVALLSERKIIQT